MEAVIFIATHFVALRHAITPRSHLQSLGQNYTLVRTRPEMAKRSRRSEFASKLVLK
jgi:hypothetical protein